MRDTKLMPRKSMNFRTQFKGVEVVGWKDRHKDKENGQCQALIWMEGVIVGLEPSL